MRAMDNNGISQNYLGDSGRSMWLEGKRERV
jgi:hypothetical protein